MAVSSVYQREIVEVPFVLPDGKVLHHSIPYLSANKSIKSTAFSNKCSNIISLSNICLLLKKHDTIVNKNGANLD